MDLEIDEFLNDIVSICRVLPTVPAATIYLELKNVMREKNRVQIVLKKWLTYNFDDSLLTDIQIIKSVVPEYPREKLNSDLLKFENGKNRVQLILKEYFKNQMKLPKRPVSVDQLLAQTCEKKRRYSEEFVNLEPHVETNNELEGASQHVDDLQPVREQKLLNIYCENSSAEEASTQEYDLDDELENFILEASMDTRVDKELDPVLLDLTSPEKKADTSKSKSHQPGPSNSVIVANQLLNTIQYNILSLSGAKNKTKAVDAVPNPSTSKSQLHQPGPSNSSVTLVNNLPSTSVTLVIAENQSPNAPQYSIPSTGAKNKTVEMVYNAVPGTSKEQVVKPRSSSSNDVIVLSVNGVPTFLDNNKNYVPEKSVTAPRGEHQFFFKLLEIFPDICPQYLRRILTQQQQISLDEWISYLLDLNYERRERIPSPTFQTDNEEQLKMLLEMFPDADPTYLQHHYERLLDQPEQLKFFVSQMLEKKNYPTKADHLKKLKLSAQEKQYTTEFNVENFLEVIPDPVAYFNSSKKQISWEDDADCTYALKFLKNHYPRLAVRDITSIFRSKKCRIIKTVKILNALPEVLKLKRKPYPFYTCSNIPLLQEIAYVKHEKEILEYIQTRKNEKEKARQKAKEEALMKTCDCCYDEEVMPSDIVLCDLGHIFCKECVKKGCEILIGENKLKFPCLADCGSDFSLQILQTVLEPKVFSKMAQKKQLEEIKAAGIEELEFCPFCDFATIPAPDDKIFRCLNDDCMKESCRLCKEPSHIPLRCDEVEKDNDIKMRTYIENKMTEALVRTCPSCKMKFIKESGCNKMTCTCGTIMCYVCKNVVKDYTHFNGQGGDQHHLCPLYSDMIQMHKNEVIQSAVNAKKELGIDSTGGLKNDPTQGVTQHFSELARRVPQKPL